MMKLRPILILLLFAAASGILVWLYVSSVDDMPRQRTARWSATISDLDACCRRKHVKAEQYDHFAEVAAAERRDDAARLFRAMALSARLQESDCARIIVQLGGGYTPPARVALFRGSTAENLVRSIDYELRLASARQGAGIDRALARGNRLAARALIRAAASDMRHIVLMERFRAGASCGAYRLCPRCGNLYEATRCDPYCPICQTAGRNFIDMQ